MKTLTTLVLAAALTGGAFSVQAAQQADRDLDLCKAEIQDFYSDNTKLTLVDRRRDIDGISMRLAARLDSDNSQFVTCWIPRREEGGFVYSRESTGLASSYAESGSENADR
ncbi:MAG: hypothetical protein IMF06_14495 [Proteobacteria bacterium]|nr:hypothetical protein [Pseudomonadota bacterium]